MLVILKQIIHTDEERVVQLQHDLSLRYLIFLLHLTLFNLFDCINLPFSVRLKLRDKHLTEAAFANQHVVLKLVCCRFWLIFTLSDKFHGFKISHIFIICC